MPHLTLSYRLLNRLLVLFVIMAFFVSAYGMYSYRRPLPQTNGSLRLAGLRDEVSLYRDVWGVPHIYATNTYDLLFCPRVCGSPRPLVVNGSEPPTWGAANSTVFMAETRKC